MADSFRSASNGPGDRPLVVLGNPENRRVRLFCEAAARLGLPAPRVAAYEDILRGEMDLARIARPGDRVRIDSPGENERVERALIALGARCSAPEEIPADYRPGQPIEHGRIDCPALWYRGFCEILGRLERELEPLPVAWMNHPADIPTLFDKCECQQRLEQQGVPVPPRLGTIAGYDELRQRMREHSQRRVFVKLRYGSSSSGVVALQAAGGRVSAVTSAELVRDGGRVSVYNSLRVREYRTEADLADLVNALAPHGLFAEAWLPKAGWNGRTFDLRVVVIAGEVCHQVMRTSRGPITNLHLGNARGGLEDFLSAAPEESLRAAYAACRRVAAAFPRSLYFGIDLMFLPGLRRHAILEVNAFGDLLPGVTYGNLDTYGMEIQAAPRVAAGGARLSGNECSGGTP